MPVLELGSVTKYFGSDLVLSGINVSVEERDHIGLVGRNGTGKTTLLRIMAQALDYDSGSVTWAPGRTVGYLAQGIGYNSGNTLYEEMRGAFARAFAVADEMRELERQMADPKMADPGVAGSERLLDRVMQRYSRLSTEFEMCGGYDYDVRIRTTLFGLGFREDDLGRVIDTLSGGQKVRVALARMLCLAPDILLLDEPTNHLDVDACEWLEGYLRSFAGAFVVVSHDRYFLDATTNRTWDLDGRTVTEYPGNYTFFVAQKELARERQAEEYERQQELIHRLEEYVRRYKAGNRTTMAQSREKMLARIQRIEKPTQSASMKLGFGRSARTGRLAVVVDRVSKAFGERRLFDRLELAVERGERLGIVGPNGSGKTTLLRIIAGDILPDEGHVALGENVSVGVFWQDLRGLNEESTVLDEVYMMRDWTLGEARSCLARFLFRGDDVFKRVSVLSGGERNRLALAKLILSAPNVLLLDEPTNHLDIESRHALDQAVSEFDGTVICASHDRYFLDQVATAILEIAEGRWRLYDGNYSYYREKKAAEMAEDAASEAAPVAAATRATAPRGGASRARSRTRDASREAVRQAGLIEAEIEQAEARLAAVEELLASEGLYSDGERAREVVTRHRAIMEELEKLYDAWEAALCEADTTGGCED
ncbi:MAG TPA: ABC-F family ATP-binding cassette domain-containing protein [Bacillota bacterium]|nr:ABC-F family ATP-binding cassette domain-containing protein [Bacillota bacterium]